MRLWEEPSWVWRPLLLEGIVRLLGQVMSFPEPHQRQSHRLGIGAEDLGIPVASPPTTGYFGVHHYYAVGECDFPLQIRLHGKTPNPGDVTPWTEGEGDNPELGRQPSSWYSNCVPSLTHRSSSIFAISFFCLLVIFFLAALSLGMMPSLFK